MKGKLLVALLIIILLVAYYLFGTGYLKQQGEQETLTSQLADATQTLAQMPEPPDDLEQRLEAAQARLSAAEHSFPASLNSTRVINTILKQAGSCGVKAIPLITQPWSMEKVGEHNYYVLRLNVAASGSLAQLLAFTDKLEKGEFGTLIVEELSVTRLTEETEGSVTGEAMPLSASLDLAIYTQPPTSD